MKFIKIKNHLINLQNIGHVFIEDARIHFYHMSDYSFISFDSEEEAKAIYEKIISWINGSYGGIGANGTIPDLSRD